MSLTKKYNYLLYVHENNFLNKISENYHTKGLEIEHFYKNEYLPLRERLLGYTFNAEESNYHYFSELAKEMDSYYRKLTDFGNRTGVSSQSKLASTFLEEHNRSTSFGIVVTLKEIHGNNLWNDFFTRCQMEGWVTRSVDVKKMVDLYNIYEQEIELD